MSEALTALGLLVGAFFMLVGSVGLVRFPDVYCRLHAPTKAQTLGMIGLLLAAVFHFERAEVTTQAVLVILFFFLTVPVGAHLMARAAYRSGVPMCREVVVDDYRPYALTTSPGAGAAGGGPSRGAAGSGGRAFLPSETLSPPGPRTGGARSIPSADRRSVDRYLRRGGLRLHARDYRSVDRGGEGLPPLLLLHGTGAHARWWDHVGPAFSDLFRAVAPDLRGHGESGWSEDYSLEALAGDIEAWAERLGGRPPVHRPPVHRPALVGHSMGGVAALAVAERGRVDLRALVVVEAPLRVPEELVEEAREFGGRPSRAYGSREEFIAHFRLWPPAEGVEDSLFRHVAAHSARRHPDGSYRLKVDKRFYLTREALDARGGWRRARCPCLLVRGSRSDRLPDGAVGEVRSLCPRVQVATLEGAGHHLFLERPGEFVAVLRRFFEGLPPAGK